MSQLDEDASGQMEDIVMKLRNSVLSELDILTTDKDQEKTSSEQRLKLLTGFFKLLQGLEEMVEQKQQERDKSSDRGVDILEYRRQLEEQIARLVDRETETAVS